MKGKRSKIGRRGKIVLAVLITTMFIGVATAALLPYYGRIKTTATVSQSVLLDGGIYTVVAEDEIFPIAGDTNYTEHTIQNDASVEAPIKFVPPELPDGLKTYYYLLELQTKDPATAIAEWSGNEHTIDVRGVSAHLKTTGTLGVGDEARIHIDMPSGTTLSDIEEISWWEYLVAGYPPHVDIIIEEEGWPNALVVEYAYNGHTGDTQPTYGALTGKWYQTFSDDGEGPAVVDDTAYAWLTSGPAGGPDIIGGTLADWKTGIKAKVEVEPGIFEMLEFNGDTIVTAIEIEIDNWMPDATENAEAYVDDIQIKGPRQRLNFALSPLTEYGMNIVYVFNVATIPGEYTYWIRIEPR